MYSGRGEEEEGIKSLTQFLTVLSPVIVVPVG